MSKKPASLKRIEAQFGEVYRVICALDSAGMKRLDKAIEGLSTTNCSWILWDSRTLLRSMIDAASPARTAAKRRAARAAAKEETP